MSAEIDQLLGILDRGYDRQSWHGTNLRGSLRGLPLAVAVWRPAPGRHNIWELVVHCAYWKYAVWRRLTQARRGSFPLTGSNWFRRPEAASGRAAWRADLQLLESVHRQLRQAVAAAPTRGLHRRLPGTEATPFHLISGVAAHDLYHAGQIQLIKRLY